MIVFRLIQALLSPLAVIGSSVYGLSLIRNAKRTGSSATVLASCYPRWLLHHLRQRWDGPCVRMMKVLPTPIRQGLRMATTPTIVAHAVTGYVPKPYRYPYEGRPSMLHQPVARTTFHDQGLERHLPQVEQFVVLGAGFDTRSYRQAVRVRCFEIDQPGTQRVKRELLAKAGVDAKHVTFVPANFGEEDWFDQLLEADFDPARPAYFLWESVAMYLERSDVERVLRRIGGLAPGSAVGFDYFTTAILQGRDPYSRYARWGTDRIGEPLRFGIDQDEVTELLRQCGLKMEEQQGFGENPIMAGFVTARV
jgi:methyltransferase (TIGR00027 family)